ncbi:hypothetical protein GCM10020000_03590 [Streptomyces olivoverticillatus]
MQCSHSTDRPDLGQLPDDAVGLAALLRAWRARVGRRMGLGKPLPQVEVAAGIGMSERWYRDLERGAMPRLDARTLAALADALRLCPDERATLFLYAAGGEPFPAVSPDSVDLTPLRRLLRLQPTQPAYLTDNAWNVLAHNEVMAEWFPWVRIPGANLVRWGADRSRGSGADGRLAPARAGVPRDAALRHGAIPGASRTRRDPAGGTRRPRVPSGYGTTAPSSSPTGTGTPSV